MRHIHGATYNGTRDSETLLATDALAEWCTKRLDKRTGITYKQRHAEHKAHLCRLDALNELENTIKKDIYSSEL